jgi:XTP/dITP diphosphohydrolase
MDKKLAAFERLLNIMDDLRSKCPWDKKQSFNNLRTLTIEETYELSDAVIKNDINGIKEELGDLMLHIVFYSKIASETNDFDITDVLNNICKKLIRRHPHIYGNVNVNNADDVAKNWENIKLKEGKKSALSGVPVSMPSLLKAYRIQEKAKGVGFDWEKPNQVWDKVKEELYELKEELDKNDNNANIEEEFGDVLFSLVNYARFINVNPVDALEKTNKKFIKRFQYLEENAYKKGKSLKNMTLNEMNVFWNKAKKEK